MTDYDIITYRPGLVLITRKAHKYMTRWQSQLEKSLTSDQKACLTAAINALSALLVCLNVL